MSHSTIMYRLCEWETETRVKNDSFKDTNNQGQNSEGNLDFPAFCAGSQKTLPLPPTRGSNSIQRPFGNRDVLHTDLKFTEMEF